MKRHVKVVRHILIHQIMIFRFVCHILPVIRQILIEIRYGFFWNCQKILKNCILVFITLIINAERFLVWTQRVEQAEMFLFHSPKSFVFSLKHSNFLFEVGLELRIWQTMCFVDKVLGWVRFIIWEAGLLKICISSLLQSPIFLLIIETPDGFKLSYIIFFEFFMVVSVLLNVLTD